LKTIVTPGQTKEVPDAAYALKEFCSVCHQSRMRLPAAENVPPQWKKEMEGCTRIAPNTWGLIT
jgi:hypothetical protein